MNNKTKELWNKVERYGTGGLAEETVDEILAILEQQQDMIKVVRCNDCMKYGHICYGIINNGYCSDGERGGK